MKEVKKYTINLGGIMPKGDYVRVEAFNALKNGIENLLDHASKCRTMDCGVIRAIINVGIREVEEKEEDD